jgi:predicted metalloprotease with PDZ domain
MANANDRAYEAVERKMRLQYSLGLLVEEDGDVADVTVGMPCASAGLSPGMKIVAVNGRRFSPNVLREAIARAKTSRDPLELLVENGDYFETLRVDYRGGERSPHLERDTSKPDLLEAITRPRTARK